ncbi:MAG: pilus assembly protein [Acidobacteria bacterium]|nr:pilus assembly protein [Acidobacteriota bacterium]
MFDICRKISLRERRAVHLVRRFFISHSDGGALVETALVVPLMLTLITGMASFGIALNNYLLLSHAAAVGARYLAINQGNFSNGTTTNPCAMAATQIQAAAVGIAASQLSYSITLTPTASGTATTYTSSNGTTGFGSGSACATGGTAAMGTGGGIVSVSVSHSVTPFVVFWSNRSLSLTGTTTEVIQ